MHVDDGYKYPAERVPSDSYTIPPVVIKGRSYRRTFGPEFPDFPFFFSPVFPVFSRKQYFKMENPPKRTALMTIMCRDTLTFTQKACREEVKFFEPESDQTISEGKDLRGEKRAYRIVRRQST